MGKKQNCENLFAYGVSTNGGFAEYCLVPETQCFLLNPELPFDAGAMMEPLACVLHGIDRVGIMPGQTVVIVGGGAIGMLMLQLAKLSGAACVLVSEPIAMRRGIALELGADGVMDPMSEDLHERMKVLSGRDGADVVIECVGNVKAVEQAFSLAGFGATILIFSVPKPNTAAALPLSDVFKKELKIMGSIINPDTNQRAVELLNRGKIKTDKIITHVYGLDSVEEAIHKQMETDSLKVVVHPQE